MNVEQHIKEFQELSLTELYSILKLRSEVFVVEQNCPYADMDDKDQDAYHLWLSSENQIVAYCRVLDNGDDSVLIGRVVVDKNFRGKKLGKDIFQTAFDLCKLNYPHKIIRISAQLYLQEFYTGFGFATVSGVYLEDGIPHVRMEIRKF